MCQCYQTSMLFTHRRHELLQKSEEAVQCIYQALCIFCPDHPLVLGKQPGVPGLNQGRKSQGLVLGMDFGIWIRHCVGVVQKVISKRHHGEYALK